MSEETERREVVYDGDSDAKMASALVHEIGCKLTTLQILHQTAQQEMAAIAEQRDRLQTQNTELLLLLDDWLMAFDLSGDHCELARAAERTRNLLTKNATEAHTAAKADFPGGYSGKPKNAAD
jgi:hypothetical protein